MWSNSEAVNEPLSYKTVTLYFLTSTCRSYFFSKITGLNYPHTDIWRRFDDDTTSSYTTLYRLHIDVETTLSISGNATLQNNKLCQKYFFRIFSYGFEQLLCKKSFGEHLFRVLHFVYRLSKTASGWYY